MAVTLRQFICRLPTPTDHRTDAGLLADFLRHTDHEAFAELVHRHGPMVFGVCRRFLGASPDAEDAFQAVFLVLVQRARRTVWRESLGPWLHAVAVRVARKARAVRARRFTTETQVHHMPPEPTTLPLEPDDRPAILDEELAALPEKYRRPLVLCELQGASRREAARELGLAEGTLSSRLARGRRLLRDRLARRGVALAAAGLTVAVPGELAAATVRNAAAVLTRAVGVVPAGILSLTEGVKAMVTKWHVLASMVALSVAVTGFGAWSGSVATPTATANEQPVPPAKSNTKPALGMDKPVATIFGDEDLLKQQFAEFLIRRHGKKELEMFVNKQIIAHAFKKKGWTLSPEEIQAALDADLKGIGVTRDQFEKDVLPRHGKTLDEWIEDVITPRVMMARLCKAQMKPPTDDELRRLFDEKYGEKIEVRMLLYRQDQAPHARAVCAKLKSDESVFEAEAKAQNSPQLSATRGRIPPLPRVVLFPQNEQVQAAIAKLAPGEVSPLIEGVTVDIEKGVLVIIKCDKVIPADTSKSFDVEKPALLKEAWEAKISHEIPKLWEELKREADPKFHLTFPDSSGPKK